MSAKTLRQAAADIREDWPEDREMGMARHEWRFHRAVADWLDMVAAGRTAINELRSQGYGHLGLDEGSYLVFDTERHALAVARAYLGEDS